MIRAILNKNQPSTALVLILIALFASINPSKASSGEEEEPLGEVIMHHITDAHSWHFFDGHYGTLHLPVILYSSDKGIEIFSSSNLYDEHHNHVTYEGRYALDEGGHLEAKAGQTFTDFSITKNVAMLFINAIIMVLIFTAVAKGYKRNQGKAPKGIQSFFEPIIVFVRDEVVKPNIGPRYEKYLPYMLHLFFFIWFGNLLGLLPGAANLTGNIAVTMVLAVLTFLITNFSGNKSYWGHIFNTPGVPLLLKPIIIPVEIIGVFTKPISLMVRLFVAISAGHIVLLSLMGLTFIFHSWAVGVGSSFVVIFINLIELLVATIQAYVFTMFSSLYIGAAIEEHH
ncbi:MAG: F0F1 ATP synthase subunit A [Bacteroidota bacterium]